MAEHLRMRPDPFVDDPREADHEKVITTVPGTWPSEHLRMRPDPFVDDPHGADHEKVITTWDTVGGTSAHAL
jgi:hypothetical protein